MTATSKPVWKTDAAMQAFVEMCKMAGMEKESLMAGVDGRSGLSSYEHTALRIQISESYTRMISGAYQTAAHIECQALELQANITAAFADRS